MCAPMCVHPLRETTPQKEREQALRYGQERETYIVKKTMEANKRQGQLRYRRAGRRFRSLERAGGGGSEQAKGGQRWWWEGGNADKQTPSHVLVILKNGKQCSDHTTATGERGRGRGEKKRRGVQCTRVPLLIRQGFLKKGVDRKGVPQEPSGRREGGYIYARAHTQTSFLHTCDEHHLRGMKEVCNHKETKGKQMDHL